MTKNATAASLTFFDGKTREAVYSVYVGRVCGRSVQYLNVNSRHTKLIARVSVSYLPDADAMTMWTVHASIARQFATENAPPAPWYRG